MNEGERKRKSEKERGFLKRARLSVDDEKKGRLVTKVMVSNIHF